MAVRLASLFLVTVLVWAAPQTVRIGVLGLFRPDRLILHASDGATTNIDLSSPPHRLVRGSGEFALEVPGRIRRLFSGSLEVGRGAAELLPVISVELESAVASVVSAELPSEASPEALRAMSVVVRSYYIGTRGRHKDFDFCDTTHCQFFRGLEGTRRDAIAAAKDTEGLILTFRGSPFGAMHFASCSGSTNTAKSIGLDGSQYPYYEVRCAACTRSPERWQREIPREYASRLKRGSSEGVRLSLGRVLGWDAVPSNHYAVDEGADAVILTGVGRGHGLGLCQRGAIGMAAAGRDFRSILKHYFPDAEIEHR